MRSSDNKWIEKKEKTQNALGKALLCTGPTRNINKKIE